MGKPMDCGVYLIENTVNRRKYVGSAVKLGWRWRKHQLHLVRGTHHSSHLQRAWNKYGEHSFLFKELIYCDRENVLFYEQRAIDVLCPKYNVCKIVGSCLGVKRSEETRKRIAAASTGRVLGDESRQRISLKLKGRIGKPHSDQSKELLSKAALARCQTESGIKQIQLLANARRGTPRTKDVKEKLSKSAARITEDQVREMRRLVAAGTPQKYFVELYGLKTSCISEAVRGITYGWVV